MFGQFEKIGKQPREFVLLRFDKNRAQHIFMLAALVVSIFSIACKKSEKINLRTLAPKDTLIYLETNNLAAALDAVTESEAFQKSAQNKTDFSALKNVPVAIVVGDFGTTENDAGTDETILNFKPHFFVVAETRLWSWQANSLVENQIDNFARQKLGADARLEKSDKEDKRFYVWTAADNRKIFALAQGSLIYFGNDETLIEKSLAAKNGAIESLASDEFFSSKNSSPDDLAFGYVSPAGIEKIAALAGIFTAAQTTESDDGRNFIAHFLPEILQDKIERIIWTAQKTDAGIEDNFEIFPQPSATLQFKEIFVGANEDENALIEFLPADFFSASRYRFKNPLAAWQNSLALFARYSGALGAELLMQFSDSLLEPYGIANAEKFLSAVDSEIIVARFDETGEQGIVIARVKNIADLKKSLTAEINFNAPSEKSDNAKIFFSANKNIAAAFVENVFVLGDAASVRRFLQAKSNNESKLKNQRFEKFAASNSLVATFGKDADSADRIARVLTGKKDETTRLATFYLTETNFSESKIERRTVSDFGLIGAILKQLEQ